MSNDAVIRCINTNFVPVALNLYKIREAKSAAGDFFRSVQKQKPQYQGLWVVTSEGKVLAGHQETKDISDWYGKWPKKVLADLESGISEFGEIKPRAVKQANSLPNRGVGVQPDGRVTLAVYDKWVLVKSLDKDPPQNALGPTILDSITLSGEECAVLAPRDVKEGAQWTVPEVVARKFFPLLSTGDSVFRDPKELTAVEINGQVEKTEKGIARLSYRGHIAGTHHGTASEGKAGKKCSGEAKLIGGAGTFDIQSGKLLSLTLVFDGLWRNYPPYDDPPGRFGAVVEWRRDN